MRTTSDHRPVDPGIAVAQDPRWSKAFDLR